MEIAFFDEEANSAGELTQFLGESATLIQARCSRDRAMCGASVPRCGASRRHLPTCSEGGM